MKQHMVHRALQGITPLRRPSPFSAAAHSQKTRKLRLGHAGKPSLLTRHVHQTEREAPPAHVTPPREPPSTTQTSSSSSHSSEQHGLLSDKEQPPTPTASLHSSSTNADGASSSPTHAETTAKDPPAQATNHASPAAPASPSPSQQPPSDPAPGPSSSRPRRPSFAFQKPSPAVVLATYGAYIGALGTLAVGTAWATDINLAAMFQWDPQDIEQALLALIPLAAFNTLIMLPDYSNWSLPNLDEKEAAEAAAAQAPASAGPSLATGTATPAPAAMPAASARPAALRAEGDAGAAADSSGKINKTPAAAWGRKKGVFRVFKDAMHLAQGHYTANNPTASMNPAVDALTASAQSLAAELLYRGVVLTLLQAWVLDRLYEGGAEDVMSLPFLSQPMDTSDAALWGASWMLVAVSLGLALRKVFSSRRPRLIQILDLKQVREKGRSKGKEAAAPSPAAAAAAEQIPRSFHQTTTAAAAVQGGRNVLQTLVLNTVFVASGGNLAASVSASLVNQLLFSALQRYNAQRMQERSASLAKELEVFNLRLREIQRKKQARVAAAAAAAVAAGTTATAEDKAALGQPGEASPGEVDGSHGLAARMHESLHGEGSAAAAAQGAGGGEVLLHAAAVATAASAAVDAAADAAASAQGSGVVAAAAAGAGSGNGGSMGSGPDQLTRALMALDLLLPPEPPSKLPAAPKPRLEK